MTFDEFMAMTEDARWKLFFDSLVADVKPPKYDTMLYTRDGCYFASECDAGRLEWELKRAEESIAEGGKYADANEKRAKALRFFLTWRRRYPSAIWTGERNREQVTARAPMAKPEVYPRTGAPRALAAPTPTTGGGYSDDDYGAGGDDDDSIPF